jgi:hypothetical protein
MVDGLLEPYVANAATRADLFEEHGTLGVASLAVEFYKKDYGSVGRLTAPYRERVVDRLRVLLYGPADWRSGRLVDELADLFTLMFNNGARPLAVTPNYDDYLHQAIADRVSSLVVRSALERSDGKPGDHFREDSIALDWDLDETIRGLVDPAPTIMQLHGYIPRVGDSDIPLLLPVIDELDYIRSEPTTFAVLKAMLQRGPALLIGTSLQDRPLLQALAETKDLAEEKHYPRYLVVATGIAHGADMARQQRIRRHSIERFEGFGVRPVYVDHYAQVAQFIAEVRYLARYFQQDYEAHELAKSAVSSGQEIADLNVTLPESYGSRLVRWAESWKQHANRADGQEKILAVLDALQDVVRQTLDLSASEVLKTEFWIRDDPAGFRGVRLWASTVSIHFQPESVRRAKFEANSEIAAVRAFLEGRPVIMAIPREEKPHQRWRTYFAIPVTLGEEQTSDLGSLPVSVIVFASMRSQDETGLVRYNRRDKMKEVVRFTVDAAKEISAIESRLWF